MYSGTSISNVAGTLRIKEKVDIQILKQAINLYIKNNDGVRIRICLDDNGDPQQYIADYEYKDIEVKDFSGFEDPVKAMQEWDRQETLKPFELLNSELFRFVIIKLNDSDIGFYIITHHIISDAWNMSLLGSYIVDYYCRLKKDSNDDSVNNTMPSYTAFIENEQLYLKSDRYEKDKNYWEKTFETVPETTYLKVRQTNEFSTKTKRKTFILPKKFTNKLREYCQENKITPYPLFLSALAMYINRISEKEDIIIGTPILNRLNRADKNTAGMFVSTVPLRISVNSNEPFSDLSQKVLDLCVSSYRHQRYPYDHILKYVREKHNIKENLYDIVISYQNSKFDKSFDVEYITRWHFNENQSNSFTMHINDRDNEGILIIDYDYHSDLYYDKEIEFIHQHVLSLLWHALDNPKKQICKIEMLTENEKKKILYDFNDTYVDYPREKTIHQLFEEQVERTPDNVAVVFENKKLTYKELNQKANSLANVLRNEGIKPNDVVGIMAPRSLEMVIGILAILKAGGAFLPIEPAFPDDRKKFLLDNSGAKLLLSTKELLSFEHGIKSIDLNDCSNYRQEKNENLPYVNVANNIVYILYTSGSTGSPKGVIIEHKSLHNFILGAKEILDFNPSSVVLSVTTICFDIFAFELFTSLLSGATVVIANENEQNNPRLLGELVLTNNVSTILTTPSRMKLFINVEEFEKSLKKVKQIMLGGEELEFNLVNKLRKLTDARIVNGYGPTEITIGATFKDVTKSNRITIGKPIINTKCYILDKYFNLVPIGIPGELCIAGEGLARGYLNNDELTNNAFVLNPFNKNERIYKTGDIARWFSEGEIEFLGRKDKQVKLRGYRIELEEIENAILKYEGIKDAVVVLKRNNDFGDFLCAYCVSDDAIRIKDLKALLASQLPRYMVPKVIMQIENIPINSNGKRDTSKLPDIDYSSLASASITKPSSEMEKKLVDIFYKLVKGSKISIDDNIFEYGADSLTVIQLISLLEKDGYNIRTEDVYKNPTIRELAQWIAQNGIKTDKIINYHKDNKKRDTGKNSIIELMEKGVLPKLDSAALSYIPDHMMIKPVDDEPVFYNYIKTSLGNIGLFCLPILGTELYQDKSRLLYLSEKAIKQAKALGAGTISLTGLIPSATGYGRDIKNIVQDIQITTGHATTAATVILSLERLLFESERDINQEKIIVLGMGSVGTAVTELLLKLYPEIKKITLCDLYEKRIKLNQLKRKLKQSYKGDIEIVYAAYGNLPKDVYDSTLIIGATNVPNIIDINLLKPGTLIIDDSGPHCFSKEDAIERLTRYNDILFTEGGVLYSKEKMENYTYLPDYIDPNIINLYSQFFTNTYSITGCILSSLLTAKNPGLLPTIGMVDCYESEKHYHALKNSSYLGAVLHCDDFVISENNIKVFRDLFGTSERKGKKYA